MIGRRERLARANAHRHSDASRNRTNAHRESARPRPWPRCAATQARRRTHTAIDREQERTRSGRSACGLGSRWAVGATARTAPSRPAATLGPAFLGRGRLLAQASRTLSLCGRIGQWLVAVVELVAVAERHALRGEERAQERRHREDLVADELEQPPDLPLGHRAQAQPGHVDERPQVRRHDEVRPGRVREDEPGVLAGHAGPEQVAIQAQRAVDLRPRSARAGPGRPRRSSGGSIVAAPLNVT